MSSPSNVQPSHAAMPDFHCWAVRSRSPAGSARAAGTDASDVVAAMGWPERSVSLVEGLGVLVHHLVAHLGSELLQVFLGDRDLLGDVAALADDGPVASPDESIRAKRLHE